MAQSQPMALSPGSVVRVPSSELTPAQEAQYPVSQTQVKSWVNAANSNVKSQPGLCPCLS